MGSPLLQSRALGDGPGPPKSRLRNEAMLVEQMAGHIGRQRAASHAPAPQGGPLPGPVLPDDPAEVLSCVKRRNQSYAPEPLRRDHRLRRRELVRRFFGRVGAVDPSVNVESFSPSGAALATSSVGCPSISASPTE